VKYTNKKAAAATFAVFAVLALSACGGNSDTETASKDNTTTEAPKVVIDEQVKTQLNPEEGQAIVPGSISSEKVEGLSADCETAVEPIRAYTTKFESGLAVDPETLNKVAELRAVAEEKCAPQEYADWYTKEFAGWLYAETK